MKATRVLVYGDSQLVINQLIGVCECTCEKLTTYYVRVLNVANEFSKISFIHVLLAENHEANEMAQIASGVNIPMGTKTVLLKLKSAPCQIWLRKEC